MCRKLDLEQINLALVYFDIVSEKETCLVEAFSAAQLKAFFEEHCRLFLHWAEQEMAHREARNRAAQQLAFPMPTFDRASVIWPSRCSRRSAPAAA
jgi:hypothetical protein